MERLQWHLMHFITRDRWYVELLDVVCLRPVKRFEAATEAECWAFVAEHSIE